MPLPDDEQLASAGLRLEVDGPRATIVLDRPARRNAQTTATWLALAAIGAGLPVDVRVVVVRGEGECFSAGLDRAMLTPEGPEGEPGFAGLLAMDDAALVEEIAGYQAGFTWLRRPDLLSVAQVHGYAIGAGFQLALACDLRVLADDAQLCMKETALGLVPDLTGTKPLVDAVGYARALEICTTARYVGAAEAATIGLATLVVRRDELAAAVHDLVAAILTQPAAAVASTKALLQQAADADLGEQVVAERTAQLPLLRALGGGTR